MRYRVTLIQKGSTQRSARMVEAVDERAAGWSVLAGGDQLIAVESIGASTAYPASQPPPPLDPPDLPPNRAKVMRWVWILLVIGLPMMLKAGLSARQAQISVDYIARDYDRIEQSLGEAGLRNTPIRYALDEAKGPRNRALWGVALGGVIALTGVGLWGWLVQAEQRWERWKATGR
jgi:hypothetical protein